MATQRPKNNVNGEVFGGTHNAVILAERLDAIGDGRLSWRLKRRFSKTMNLWRRIQEGMREEWMRVHLRSLILKDTIEFCESLHVSKEIGDRFFGVIRNATFRPQQQR